MDFKQANKYTIAVHQNKIKNNQVTALHLMVGILFFILGLVTWGIPPEIKTKKFLFLENFGILYALTGLALIIISIFFNKKIIQSKKGEILRIIELFALIMIILFSFMQKWYLPAAYSITALIAIAFAYLWEKKAKKTMHVQINNDGIELPFFIKNKILSWNELQRVIIKHNVLSIDCRNNKLIQYNINSLYNNSIQEVQEFSSLQIKENEHLANKDW